MWPAERMDGLICLQREADRCAEEWEHARDPRAEGLSALIAIETLRTLALVTMAELGERHLAVRQEWTAPLVAELEDWMRIKRAGLSRHAAVAKAMDYMLKRWDGFTRFLDDGRFCLTNNTAERALRGIALGRKSWLFCGSDRGGDVHAHRHRQVERCRPARLACRCPHTHRRPAAAPSARAPPLALED